MSNPRDFRCPTCGVDGGRACRSLTSGRANTDTHKARRDLANKIQADSEELSLESASLPAVRVGALFAGYGGIELALQDVFGSTDLRWVCEFDAAPSKILAHRFPGVPNFGDVTKVDWYSVDPVDVITGGSPCQDLSHAGKRRGMKPGTRSGLWASMCDAIEIIRPALVVWENVKGALSAEASSDLESCSGCVGDVTERPALRALGRVLGDLAELRYDAWWYGLRAADVGAAHGRFREFVLAVPAETLQHAGHDAGGSEREREQAEPGQRTRWSRTPSPVVEFARALAAGLGLGDAEPVRVPGLTTLLPTPVVSDLKGSALDYGPRPEGYAQLRDVGHLLPTPIGSDSHGSALEPGRPHYDLNLRDVGHLLPTPDAYAGDRGGSQHPDKRADGRHSISLADVTEHKLLPTPVAGEADASSIMGTGRRAATGQVYLTNVIADVTDNDPLLPTPTAMMPERDSKDRRAARAAGLTKTGPGLSEAVIDRLLPTPKAYDGGPPGRDAAGNEFTPNLETVAREHLLPTPMTSDSSGPIDPMNRTRKGMPQLSDTARLLPTPKATNNENEPGRDPATGEEFSLNLGQTIKRQDWREYAPAIERWEAVTGRPAPSPLEWSENVKRRLRGEDKRPVGRRGPIRKVLSPAFVEWLMGLPAGWVTDPAIDIRRTEQLKALGNGVVPQQCAAALRTFLADLIQALADMEQSA